MKRHRCIWEDEEEEAALMECLVMAAFCRIVILG